MEREMHAGDGDQSNSGPKNGGSDPNSKSPELPDHSATIHRWSQSADDLRFPGATDMDFSEEDLDIDDLDDPILMSDYGSDNNVDSAVSRPRHRYSNSIDASSSEAIATDGTVFAEINEGKKSMPPQELAELWHNDPKRAKRIVANRQSANRSKERRAQYIRELEKTVDALRNEDMSLSTELTSYQRDTASMTNQNAQLRLRLQVLEHRGDLRDVVNDVLREEVERLRAMLPQNIQRNSQQTSESGQNDALGGLQNLNISSNSAAPKPPQ